MGISFSGGSALVVGYDAHGCAWEHCHHFWSGKNPFVWPCVESVGEYKQQFTATVGCVHEHVVELSLCRFCWLCWRTTLEQGLINCNSCAVGAHVEVPLVLVGVVEHV